MECRSSAALALLVAVLLLVPISARAAKPQPFLLPGVPTMIKDLNGSTSSQAFPLFSNAGKTFFQANDATNGYELWVTDGTDAGTTFLKDINPGLFGVTIYPGSAVALGNVVLFILDYVGGPGGSALWRTDGTPAGTFELVKLDFFGALDGVAMNGVAYYNLAVGGAGTELWRSDGTVAGTTLVKDINASGNGLQNGPWVVNNTLLFEGFDGTNSYLWKSDGTAAGTTQVKLLRPNANAAVGCFTEILGKGYFTAQDPNLGYEPFVTDGTTAGTYLIKDIEAGAGGSSPCGFTELKGLVYFYASTLALGRELYVTDGTAANTTLVKDIYTGQLGSSNSGNDPAMLTINDRLFWLGADATTGNEPWVSDGTSAGTVRLADIWPGASSSVQSSASAILGKAGNYVYFAANNSTDGYELYRTDGSTLQYLGDKNPGSASFGPFALTMFPIGPGVGGPVVSVNGLPVFAGITAATSSELYTVTPSGIVTMLGPITNTLDAFSFAQNGSINNGVLIFAPNDDRNNRELWKLPPVNPDVQKQSVTSVGKSDVLFQHTDGRTYGWAVNGGALLTASPLASLGGGFRVKGVGDFNGDGPDDLLLRDGSGNNKIVRLGAAGNAMTVLGTNDIVPAGVNWDIAAVGDFDGDGRDDILWREVGGYNFMFTQFNAATGAVVQYAVAGLGIDWKVAGVADFDGDGKADIFWRNINGANAIWLMDGPRVKQILNVAGIGSDWTLAGIADFDRDGKPDLLWRNIGGYNGIWFMDKNVVRRVMDIPGVTPDWRVVGTGDYDGDGFADILWEQTVNGTRVVWLLDAGAYRTESALPGTGDIGWQVVNPVSTR